MILRVLGTAAAEAWPAPFCVCEACDRARFRGGKDVRSRASYLIGDAVKVDWPPDSVMHALRDGLDYALVKHLFITHGHFDHCAVGDLEFRRQGFAVLGEGAVLNVYGSQAVLDYLNGRLREPQALALKYHRLRVLEPVTVERTITVTPVRAAHASEEEEALNFVIETGRKSILIGHDTGWYAEETWDFLGTKELDVLFMDCTMGPQAGRIGHMGIPALIEVQQELRKRGALAPDCQFLATHFSHNGGMLHEDLEAELEPHGMRAAYDGLELEV